MARLGLALILSVFLYQQCLGAPRVGFEARAVSQNLYIDNAFNQDIGEWGPIELCAAGSFATAVEIKYQAPDNLDETAVNGIRLYCNDEATMMNTGYISSTVEKHGDWYGMSICTTGFVTGFRANVLKDQGIFVDDVAVENIEIDCEYGTQVLPGLPMPVPMKIKEEGIEPYGFKQGDWSTFATCRDGLAVCGIQTRYEASLGDEVAIADAVLFCCARTVF